MMTDRDELYDEDSWEAAAHWVIERNSLRPNMVDVPESFEDLYNRGEMSGLARRAWKQLDYHFGGWTADQMVDLLASKQHDYGNDNILKFGPEGIKVRLWDKIARYNNLMRRGVRPANEDLVDTYKDIIGYVVLLKMVNAGTFTLKLKGDM